MKNKIKTVFVLFIISTMGLVGQNSNNLSIGPKVGVNLSNVNGESTEIIPGLAFGLTSTYSFLETNGIGIDLLYSGQGFKNGNSITRINYLKVPVLYKLFFNELGDAFRPRIEVGFSPGFLLNAKNGETIVSNAYENFEVGVIGGLGFNYRLSNRMWLNADARADFGLTDIRTNNSDLNNRNINFNVGIAYGL